MKSFRSSIGLLLASAMMLTSTPAMARTLYKYTSDSVEQSSTAVSYVKRQGFMTGYSYGGFGENNSVNRAEFAKVVTHIYSSQVDDNYSLTLPFRDTAKNAWYTPYIVYVYGNGLMTGYGDNTFRPDHTVSFAEAAKVLAMIYDLDMNNNSSRWYEGAVRALDEENAIPLSINSINDPLTRGELADIVYRLDDHRTNLSSRSYNDLVDGNYSDDWNDDYNDDYNDNDNNYSANCRSASDLAISIGTISSSVEPGDEIAYDITVKNCTGDDQSVDVTATLDSQLSFDSASDSGRMDGSRRVKWTNLRIDDGEVETLSLRVTVEDYAGTNDSVDLDVRATDDDGHSDSVSKAFYLSGTQNCYYDAHNRYICNNSNNHYNSGDCYYDSNNRYICTHNSSTNCYYDANGYYQCNNNNGGYYDNDCYYDSYNRYICDQNHDGNCYYNSSGNYVCPNSTTNNCYYDVNNRYVCSDNYNNGSNCYYDSNNRYICNSGNTGGSGYCYYDIYNNYICY